MTYILKLGKGSCRELQWMSPTDTVGTLAGQSTVDIGVNNVRYTNRKTPQEEHTSIV
jgi:hypothetical protein